MRGSRAKQIRKLVKKVHNLVKGVPAYDTIDHVVMIKGWVNEEGVMVQKNVPVQKKQRTHKPNTFKFYVNFYKGLVREGAQ